MLMQKLFVLWKRQRLTWAQAHAHGGCGGDGGGERVVPAVPGMVVVGGGGGAGGSIEMRCITVKLAWLTLRSR